MSLRPVKRVIESKPTIEGAGVHLRRAFGFGNTTDFDPFLLLDDFRNDVPEDYLAGFPWHPHRGIETITYVLAGPWSTATAWAISGTIAAGDVQWMTAGSGIIHQEMPKGDDAGRMHGFQLWANLPVVAQDDRAALSGSESARHSRSYRRRRHARARGVRKLLGQDGPGGRHRRRSRFIWMSRCRRGAGRRCRWRPRGTRSRMCSRAAGSSATRRARWRCPPKSAEWLDTTPPAEADNRSLVLFDRGDEVAVQAGDDGIRFLLVSGKPLEEPVAWYGPIVMNTQEQLREAFEELEKGTFLKGTGAARVTRGRRDIHGTRFSDRRVAAA